MYYGAQQGGEEMKEDRISIRKNMRKYGMLIALIAIMILFGILTEGILFKPMNISNLIQQNAYVLILAIGMLLVIITGNVDLSVGSVVAFIGAISAIFMIQWNMPVWVSVILSILIGALVGAFQGFFIAYLNIPPFIVTLAGMLIFRGLTMVILKGQTLGPFDRSFQTIASGFIHGGEIGGLNVISILVGILLSIVYIVLNFRDRKKKIEYKFQVPPMSMEILKTVLIILAINWLTYSLAAYKGLPIVLIILGILIMIYSFTTNRTIAGRHIYALGGNAKAAKLSGIKTEKVLFWVYVNMGALAALAGLVVAGRLNAATPKAGTGFELDAIAACYIGGASASGGIGTVTGAIVGGLVMGVLNNGMSILGIGVDWQQAIKGLVLLAAVTFDVYTKSKSSSQ